MIRRWSCIIDITLNFNILSQFKKTHKIALFKSSVNFKRFAFKVTKFKRRALMRLKHRSSFLIYNNIFKYWVKDFMFNKLYLKYQFFNRIFVNNFFFYNFNFIFTTLNNKKFFYFSHNKSIIKNSPLTAAWFVLKPNLSTSVIPFYLNFQNLYFSYENMSSIDFNVTEVFDIPFNLMLKKIVEIRRIVSILFFIKLI